MPFLSRTLRTVAEAGFKCLRESLPFVSGSFTVGLKACAASCSTFAGAPVSAGGAGNALCWGGMVAFAQVGKYWKPRPPAAGEPAEGLKVQLNDGLVCVPQRNLFQDMVELVWAVPMRGPDCNALSLIGCGSPPGEPAYLVMAS